MVDLKLDASLVKRALERAGPELGRNIRKALQLSARDLDRTLQTERLRGRPGLKRRTGALARSFHHVVVSPAGQPIAQKMIYWTNLPYARIQQTGGVIRPRRGKYLTIPVGANLTPAGVMRVQARQLQGSFVRPGRRGHLLLFERQGKGKPRLMFVLVRQVRIPPRLHLFGTWRKVHPRFVQRLTVAFKQALGQAGFRQ